MAHKKFALTFTALVLMSNPMAYAGPFEDGLAAVDAGDYVNAQHLIETASWDGNVDAQLYLANFLYYGMGESVDKIMAAYWYEQAAENGNPQAMVLVGIMSEKGDGIDQSLEMAQHWYEKAANMGNTQAASLRDELKQKELLRSGNTKPDGYYEQETRTRNTASVNALAILKSKAEAGDAEAQEKLGLRYYEGDGVAQSYEQAEIWIEKAAIERRMDAMMTFAKMFEEGQGVQKNMRHAKLWYEEAAKKGNTQAAKWLKAYTESLGASAPTIVKAVPKYKPMPSIVLDQAYSPGTLTAADRKLQTFKHDEGVRLSNQGEYSLARLNWKPYAEAGIVRFQFNMGHSYLAEKDFANALLWFKRAASAPTVDTNYFKIAEAQFRIGLAYVAGDGVEADPTTAAAWFHLAVDHLVPNDKAEEMLGLMYYEGTGVPADRSNAIKYLRGADSSETWVMLGLLLEEGYQGFTWPKEAVKYYEKAANKGIADGQYLLGMRYAEGEHVPENIRLAKKWLKKAADQGHGKAEAKLTEFAAQ